MNIPDSTDNVIEHREIVKNVILYHASLIPRSKTIEILTKFDESNDEYALVKTGWKRGREINEILILVVLKGKGVQIRVDKTKKKIAKDLIRQGINKDYIALPRRFFSNFEPNLTPSISGASYLASNKSGRISIYIIFFLFLLIVGVVLAFLLRYNYILDKFSFFGASIVLAFGTILSLIIWTILDNLPNQLTYITENNYQTAAITSQNQDKVKPAWDISAATLSAYFNRNLLQIDWIFRLSVITMLCGIILIAFTIALVYQKPSLTLIIAGSITGTLTQIISLIALFIYRSTLIQANRNTETIIITNYIGTAMKILDEINVKELETLDKVTEIKIEIAKLLLANAQEVQKANENQPRRRRRRRLRD